MLTMSVGPCVVVKGLWTVLRDCTQIAMHLHLPSYLASLTDFCLKHMSIFCTWQPVLSLLVQCVPDVRSTLAIPCGDEWSLSLESACAYVGHTVGPRSSWGLGARSFSYFCCSGERRNSHFFLPAYQKEMSYQKGQRIGENEILKDVCMCVCVLESKHTKHFWSTLSPRVIRNLFRN